MKHNYKIRLNEPPPSDEQIARHKNFDRILADYHNLTQPIYRRPLYKSPKAFIGLVLILVIGFLVFEAVDEEREKIAEKEIPEAIRQAEQNAFLRPALSDYSIPYEVAALTAGKPLELESGLQIEVPPSAFAQADGSPVPDEEVRLHVRQIRDPYEMVLAGIPMHTLDGEKPLQLESDFMVDIRAEANGKPVSLKKGGKLTLLLPPTTQAPARDLHLYQLDTVGRHWLSLEPGYKVLERPEPERSMVTNLPLSDGMNMLEFDENGNAVRVSGSNEADSAKVGLLYQRRLEIETLGIFGLDRRIENSGPDHSSMRTAKVRLRGHSEPSKKIYALYKIVEGMNTVAYYWPQDKEFTFELSFVPGLAQTFFGFNEEGRLIILNSVALENVEGTEVATIQNYTTSLYPVKDLADLKQLLSDDKGQ